MADADQDELAGAWAPLAAVRAKDPAFARHDTLQRVLVTGAYKRPQDYGDFYFHARADCPALQAWGADAHIWFLAWVEERDARGAGLFFCLRCRNDL